MTSDVQAFASVAETVVLPRASEIAAGETASHTVGAPSSSVSVTAPRTAPIRWSFAAAADRFTVRSAWCAALSTAVIVTVSDEAAVRSAGIVMVASAPTVYAPATGDTVIVVAALEAWLRVAVTVPTPPFSEMARGETASVTAGAASSFSMIRAGVGAVVTSSAFSTRTASGTPTSAASTALSTATTVAVSDSFVVLPAGIVIEPSAPTA